MRKLWMGTMLLITGCGGLVAADQCPIMVGHYTATLTRLSGDCGVGGVQAIDSDGVPDIVCLGCTMETATLSQHACQLEATMVDQGTSMRVSERLWWSGDRTHVEGLLSMSNRTCTGGQYTVRLDR